MPIDPPDDLTALLGSRICHDLISPLGAIGNGLELLMMSGAAEGPEITLISDSVANASARIRFFRIAYGVAMPGQQVARREIRSILDDMTRGGRLAIDWQIAGDPPRTDVKLAFIALQCFETALPHGGRVTVTQDERWRIEATGERLKADPELWSRLKGSETGGAVAPAHLQFVLLPMELRRAGRQIALDIGPDRIALSY